MDLYYFLPEGDEGEPQFFARASDSTLETIARFYNDRQITVLMDGGRFTALPLDTLVSALVGKVKNAGTLADPMCVRVRSGLLLTEVLASHTPWLDAQTLSKMPTKIAVAERLELLPWDLKPEEVSSGRHAPAPWRGPESNRVASHVLRVCKAMLNQMGRAGICYHQQMHEVNNCVPDFTWLNMGDRQMPNVGASELAALLTRRAISFIEGKVRSVLELASKVREYNAQHPWQQPFREDSLLGAALAGHVGAWNTGIKYGAVTDYERTWAFKQLGDGKVHISDAFPCAGRDGQARQDLSVTEVVIFLVLSAAEEPRMPFPGDDVGSPGGGDGGGSRGSGGDGPLGSIGGGSGTGAGPPGSMGGDCGTGAGPPGSMGGGSGLGGSSLASSSRCLQQLEILGYGVNGTVRKARLNGELVALKMADSNNAEEAVPLLKHEAAVYEALSPLQGKVIPKLVSYGYAYGGMALFLATSLVVGSHPRTGQVISGQRKGAVKALGMIHRAGYLRMDIRMENLVVEESTGQVFIIDFGFSRSKEECLGGFEPACKAEMAKLHNLLVRRSADSADSEQTDMG